MDVSERPLDTALRQWPSSQGKDHEDHKTLEAPKEEGIPELYPAIGADSGEH